MYTFRYELINVFINELVTDKYTSLMTQSPSKSPTSEHMSLYEAILDTNHNTPSIIVIHLILQNAFRLSPGNTTFLTSSSIV